MKHIKRLLMLFMMLGIFFYTFDIHAEKVTIPTSSGGDLTHIGSNEKVYIDSEYHIKDTDFRACWVSPLVGDIDGYTSEAQYKKQMIEVFKTMEFYNLNVMVFHVRIMNDAFYPSTYCSWSTYYNTNPDWEPLPWIIEECHKRGIEFHAWMNPYRVRNGSFDLKELASNYPSSNMASNPNNLLQGENAVILNPGIPAIQKWLVKVCMEVVENYDVDAIHFDDYFYDNKVDDTNTRLIYNTDNLSLGDFRRLQVDTFISSLSTSIRTYNKENNKNVQLGISPSGVYLSGSGVVNYDNEGNAITDGSRTKTTYEHYDNYLYSDTLKWVNEEWIDYILPQTYWATDHPLCAYADLLEWWDKVCKYNKVNLYAGLGLYQRTNESGYSWYNNNKEAYYEIMIANGMENVHGICFFAYLDVLAAKKTPSIMEGVKDIWSIPSILPEIRSAEKVIPSKISSLSIVKNEAGYKLSFPENDDAKFYVIYRSENPITYSPEEVYDVIGNISNEGTIEFTDQNITKEKYYYGVRCQSRTLSLGDGISISTLEATDGSLSSLEKLNDLTFAGPLIAGESVPLIFSNIYYPFGSNISYSLEYSFDDSDKKQVLSNPITRSGYLCFNIPVPIDAKEFNGKVISKNNIAISTTEIKQKVVEPLPNIKNFVIIGEPFVGTRVEFIWNDLHIAGSKYTVQVSYDNLNWNDVQTNIGYGSKLNVRIPLNLVKYTGKVYYRVLVKKDDSIGKSNIFTLDIKERLGEIKNFTINGEAPQSKYSMNEGDLLTFDFEKINVKNENVSCMVLVSYDLNEWVSIRSYAPTFRQELIDNMYKNRLTLEGSYYKIYLKIVFETPTKATEIEPITIFINVAWMYPEEFGDFQNSELQSFLNKMDIFN